MVCYPSQVSVKLKMSFKNSKIKICSDPPTAKTNSSTKRGRKQLSVLMLPVSVGTKQVQINVLCPWVK